MSSDTGAGHRRDALGTGLGCDRRPHMTRNHVRNPCANILRAVSKARQSFMKGFTTGEIRSLVSPVTGGRRTARRACQQATGRAAGIARGEGPAGVERAMAKKRCPGTGGQKPLRRRHSATDGRTDARAQIPAQCGETKIN
ncbi:hypothetical protein GCM10010486_11820 [Nonomuraea roseoviolacea subsp. carminata]